jgi:hypothetical protein
VASISSLQNYSTDETRTTIANKLFRHGAIQEKQLANGYLVLNIDAVPMHVLLSICEALQTELNL